MSKLTLIASLTLLVSFTACAASQDVADDPADRMAEVASASVVGDECTEKLTDDNDACTRRFNTCMASARTLRDRIACRIARAACMAEAFAKYVGCMRQHTQSTQPTTQPASQPALFTAAQLTIGAEAGGDVIAVPVDRCAARLSRDLRECDAAYHLCLAAAHTADEALACVDANLQCVLSAIDRYFDCITHSPVPAEPAPV